jgi:putative Ca2+/H+ antiporter (TMEM165/GDT1 family)
MGYYLLKLVITSVLIVAISEIGKKSSQVGAVLASVPLVSVLALVWLYIDTRDAEKVAALAGSIFWLVIPSLILFISLLLLLRHGVNFYLSLALSMSLMVCGYWLTVFLLRKLGNPL